MRLLNFSSQFCNWKLITSAQSSRDYRFCIKPLAKRKSAKKPRKDYGQSQKGKILKSKELGLADESKDLSNGSSLDDDDVPKIGVKSDNFPSRDAVLQACTFTSGSIAALGLVIRQVSHVASMEGLPILDCSTQVSFSFDTWQLELITGLVMLISSCRYLLLKTWPDFAESSKAANRQVLTSLQPLDYIIVSFLPGISEELLFRGALLPLLGMDWKSVLVSASIFGVLHLGSGRKYSFGLWATFVGLVYGYAAIASSSIIVPMASHALNNLVGGILWRSTSNNLSNSLD